MNSSLASATPRGSFEERALRLHDALGLGLDVIPDTVQENASATLSRVMERRQLSAEHTVIGFFGATGSGKSTLFNTIAGMPLARTAVTRPTTSDGTEAKSFWTGLRSNIGSIPRRTNRYARFVPKHKIRRQILQHPTKS